MKPENQLFKRDSKLGNPHGIFSGSTKSRQTLGGGERAQCSFDAKHGATNQDVLGGCLTYFFNFHPDSADSWGN